MANRVVIDIEARLTDNTAQGVNSARRRIDSLDTSTRRAQNDLNRLGRTRVNPTISADNSKFLRAVAKAQERADRLGRTRVSAVLGVVDKSTRKVMEITARLKAYGSSKWNAFLGIEDRNSVSTLEAVINKGRSIAGKTWRATVSIVDNAMAPLRTIRNMLFNIKTLAAGIFAGFATQKLVFDPVNLADTIESSKIAFSTKLGSESKAEDFLNQIYKFDEKSPFDTMQIVQITQRMMNMGWEAQNALTDLETIGDWAASMGKGEEGIDRVTLALGQMRQKGQLSAEEMLQLTEAGVSGWQYLADYLGKTIPEVRKMSEKGEIDINDAINGILSGMKEFEGAAAANADRTVSGIKDQMASLIQTYIKLPWGEGLASGFKDGLGELRDLLDENKDKFKEWGATLKEIGTEASTWFAEKVRNMISVIDEITNSDAFKNASAGGKVGMLWKGLITDPLSDWWNGGGREDVQDKAVEIGAAIAEGVIKGLGSFLVNHPIASILLGSLGGLKMAGGGSILGGLGKMFSAASIGATGNAMTAGSGILGKLASIGYTSVGPTAGMYFGSMAGTMSGTAAAGLGFAGVAGGVAGGLSLISGLSDLYKGYKNEDKASTTSGAWKVGGVAGGAAIGAALGSVIPGIGTLVGGLAGAGIGGIAGWIKGKKEAEELTAAMDDTSESAAKLRIEQEKLAAVSLDEHMGKIALSADDLEIAISNIVGGGKIKQLETITNSITTAKESYDGLKATEESLKKSLWMASIATDAKLAKTEIDSLKATTKSYADTAKTYLQDSQYAAVQSVQALMGTSDEAQKIIDSTNEYYKNQQDALSKLSTELTDTLNKALSDGVLSLDEEASIEKIRGQIAEITAQIAKDDYTADMNILKAKYGGGDLTAESFGDLMSGVQDTASNLAETYWDAFGQASIGKSEAEINKLKEGLYSQLATLWTDAGDLGLGTLREQYADEFGILGQDFAELFKNGVTPQIKEAMNSLTQDEETMAAVSTFVDQLAPTTEQIQNIVSQYETLGMEVPAALTAYLDTVNFYDALTGGYTEAMEYLNQNRTVHPELTIDPKYLLNQYNPQGLIPEEDTLTPVMQVKPNFSYTPFQAYLLNPTSTVLRPSITINPNYNYVKPTIPGSFRGGIYGGKFAGGGYVKGGAQLITVAEEGTPEAIIPLGRNRRQRALELFREVGERIGAPGFSAEKFAAGGITGGTSITAGITGGEKKVVIDVGGINLHVSSVDKDTDIEEAAEKIAGALEAKLRGVFANTAAGGA